MSAKFPPLAQASSESALNDARHGVSMRASYPFAPLASSSAVRESNPIKLFPKQADRVTAAWIERERSSASRKLEVNSTAWLTGEKAPHDGLLSSGANFGIVDTSTDTSKLRATFRRMHAGGLFEQPGRELESAEETAQAMAMARAPALGEQSDEYVLVSTDRLRELAVLERTLRQERSVLATQCGWILGRSHISLHKPTPACGLAISDMCSTEMRRAEGAMAELSAKRAEAAAYWRKRDFNQQVGNTGTLGKGAKRPRSSEHGGGGENELRGFTKSELMSAPIAGRAERLGRLRARAERDARTRENEAMAFEEAHTRIAMRHIDARERRADYELYCRLAPVIGLFDEVRFTALSKPGREALRIANRGATSFQRMWKFRWPLRKQRKVFSTISIQKLGRGRLARRRWGPAIRLRLRCGRLKYLRVTFKPWAERARKSLRAKAMMRGVLTRLTRATLVAWHAHVKDEKEEKEQRASRQLRRMLNAQLYLVWEAWSRYAMRCREVRRRARRSLSAPQFVWWVAFVRDVKREREENRACSVIQHAVRGRQWRKVYYRILGLRIRLKRRIYQWRMRSALQRDIAAKRLAGAEKKVDKERAEERRVVVEEEASWRTKCNWALGKAAEKAEEDETKKQKNSKVLKLIQEEAERTGSTQQAVKEKRLERAVQLGRDLTAHSEKAKASARKETLRKFWDEEAFNKLSETNLEAARITEVMNDEKWRVPLRKFLEVEGGAPLDTFSFWIQAALWRNQPCDTGESEVIYRLMVAQLWHDFIDNSATLTPAAGISDETRQSCKKWAAGLPRPKHGHVEGKRKKPNKLMRFFGSIRRAFNATFKELPLTPDPMPFYVAQEEAAAWLAREVGVEWWRSDGGVKVSAAREERKRRADKEFVQKLVANERALVVGDVRAYKREAIVREKTREAAREWANKGADAGLDAVIESLITDSLNSAHLEREWAVAAMASEAVGACFDDAVKEVFNDMLVDAISEETLERLEEEYFSDGLDELVPMLQDAHVLSEHWYLTKASYACQLLLVEAEVLDRDLFEKERERISTEAQKKALDVVAMKAAEDEAERRLAREQAEKERLVAEAEMRRKIAADRAQGIYSDQDQAATLCMQRAWRARKARNQMRRMLAGMWRKGFDTASGQYYYENTVSGVTQYERPHLLGKLFPGSNF